MPPAASSRKAVASASNSAKPAASGAKAKAGVKQKPPPRSKSPAKRTTHQPLAPADVTSGSAEAITSKPPAEATSLAPSAEQEAVDMSVRIKYNHYNKPFLLAKGGKLAWESIDEEYCIGFVFKGSFGKTLTHHASGQVIYHGSDGFFAGLQGEEQYELTITEDEEAEAVARAAKGGNKSYKARENDVTGVTTASRMVTEELKGLSVEEIRASSDRYKALLEARDLEDVLYGNG